MVFTGIIATFIVAIIGIVCGFPNGGPPYSCRNQIPGHSNGTQGGPAPYSVSVRDSVIRPGGSTFVVLESTGDFPFKGFLCAVSHRFDSNNSTVGMMSLSPSSSVSSSDVIQPLTCSRSTPYTAVTHVNSQDKYRIEFEWSAPLDATVGDQYKLRCSAVMTFFRCWTNLHADITIGVPTTETRTTSGGSSSGGSTQVTSRPNTGMAGGSNVNNNNNNNSNNNNSTGVSDFDPQSTRSPATTTTTDNSNIPPFFNNRPAPLPTAPPTSVGTGLGNTNTNFNPNTNIIPNGNLPNVVNTNGFFPANPNPLPRTSPAGFDTSLFNSRPNTNANAFNNGFLFFPVDDDSFNPAINTIFTNLNLPNLNSALNGDNTIRTNPNPGMNRDNRPRNRPQLLNSNTPNLGDNAGQFRGPNSRNRNPSRPNLINRNLVRTNEQFVDPNAISDLGLSLPNAFFLTPGAIRRFRERNMLFRNNN